jgi:transcriptional regulator with XRE-family HTH domain
MPRHIIHQPRYLGENIRRLRQSRDWTLDRLATTVGLSKGYLSLIESGKRSPHWSVLMRMIHALGETLCGFFTRAESIPPPEDGIRTRREHMIILEGPMPDERGSVTVEATTPFTAIITPWHGALRTEVVEILLPPHTEWTPTPISFPGNVTAWGMGGRLLLVQSGTEYVIRDGECLLYDASVPHTLRNYTDHPTRAVLMVEGAGF